MLFLLNSYFYCTGWSVLQKRQFCDHVFLIECRNDYLKISISHFIFTNLRLGTQLSVIVAQSVILLSSDSPIITIPSGVIAMFCKIKFTKFVICFFAYETHKQKLWILCLDSTIFLGIKYQHYRSSNLRVYCRIYTWISVPLSASKTFSTT